jgi:hypothetical protein
MQSGERDMALTAAYFLLRAREARDAARCLQDPKLSLMFLDIARSYETLARNEEWLDGERPALAGVAPH